MVPATKLFQSLLDLPGAAEWFGIVEPAWLSLDPRSLEALREEPSNRPGALRISPDLTEADADVSPILRNAIILLEAVSEGDGLKLTATGNLARAVVDDMRDRFESGRDTKRRAPSRFTRSSTSRISCLCISF